MNILEMHIATRMELDKTQDFQYPDFQPEQIDYWLNKGYQQHVEDTAYPIQQGKIPFEQTQKRIDELREIVKSETIATTTIGTNYLTQLPNDYNHLVRHQCRTLVNNISNLVSGIETNQDKINIQLKDPFWKPIPNEPLYYIIDNAIVYETKGDFQIVESYLTYIKSLVKMRLGSQYTIPSTDIDCEISSEYVQHQIINRAVNMMLENIESQRYQTNLNELNKTD